MSLIVSDLFKSLTDDGTDLCVCAPNLVYSGIKYHNFLDPLCTIFKLYDF